MQREAAKIVCLRAVGQRFVDGMSNEYDSTFPAELEGRADPAEFERTIADLNHLLAAYWPCCWCFYLLGYGCCLCTAGLSLLAPRMCIADVSAFDLQLYSSSAAVWRRRRHTLLSQH
jgi:hypothetical protein